MTLFLTQRFDEALIMATHLHKNQLRKGSQVPYISHLLAVTALVLEDGGDEDQAIAALLHDAVEDQGGMEVLLEIRERFGERVGEIVLGCTDSYEIPKPPWRGRKETYTEHLKGASPDVLRVSLADKLHNSRRLLMDLRSIGEQTWGRFNGGKKGTLWYYTTLVSVFEKTSSSPMVAELARVVGDIVDLADR